MDKIISILSRQGITANTAPYGLSADVLQEKLYDTCSALYSEGGLKFLIDVVGMDYGDSLGVVYYLSAVAPTVAASNAEGGREVLALRTATANLDKPQLLSICEFWASAGLYEREVHDFFGIVFVNNPDMRRLFLRSDWKGYPLRKNYNAENPIPLRNEAICDMERVTSTVYVADGDIAAGAATVATDDGKAGSKAGGGVAVASGGAVIAVNATDGGKSDGKAGGGIASDATTVTTDGGEIDSETDGKVPTVSLSMGTTVEQISKIFTEDEYIVNFGPQHPAMHGVLHLRVSLDGEIIRKVDPNFGYIHRGVEKMCEGYTYPQILHLTDRLDYLSGTINRHGFCLCVENALGMEIPLRAQYVRVIFDELTRIASHLLGWGCMAMDMGAITAFIYGMRDREKIMDIFEETSGGRLMAGYSIIGGLSSDIHPNFVKRVKDFIPYMRKMLKEHHILFTGNPIARGRMDGTGVLPLETAIALGVTGPAGRASGWNNDLRKIAPYSAYVHTDFDVLTRKGGTAFDRYIIRLDEIEQSLRIIEQLIDNIPEGAYAEKTKAIIKLPEGNFFQRVENARGQFTIHITSRGDKTPYRVKFRSPSMTLVSGLKAVADGGKVADLIMNGASFDYVIPCIDR